MLVSNKKIPLIIAIVFALQINALAALNFVIPSEHRTLFYTGEDVFIALQNNSFRDAKIPSDDIGAYGVGPYYIQVNSVENLSGSSYIPTFTPSYRPLKQQIVTNNDRDNDNAWQNNQLFWMELVSKDVKPGTYRCNFSVKSNNESGANNLSFQFTVIEPQSKINVDVKDPAASYQRQIDLNTRLRNDTESDVTLNRPYYDYYFTKREKKASLNVWVDLGNACIEILDCGNKNLVLRHRYNDEITIKSKSAYSKSYSQVGFLELDANTPFPEKYDRPNDLTQDFSYKHNGRYAISYWERAAQRNSHISTNIAIYQNNNTKINGSAPSWYSTETCKLVKYNSLKDVGIVDGYNLERNYCNHTNSQPPEILIDDKTDVIYEGEDYFFRPEVSDPEDDPVEITVSGLDWIEAGNPYDYWAGDNYSEAITDNLKYKKYGYIRSKNGYVRQTRNIKPGTYTYTIHATDPYGNTSQKQRKIQVVDGSEHPNAKSTGLAVLMGDETWYKPYQLDIATGIENYSDNDVTLTNFYYDYYGYSSNGTLYSRSNWPREWYLNDGFSPIGYKGYKMGEIARMSDCGNGRFRIRFKYSGSVTIPSKYSLFDNKEAFVYANVTKREKRYDWSLSPYTKGNPVEYDTLRYRAYAARVPLYDGNHKLLWGEAPSWKDQCVDLYRNDADNNVYDDNGNVYIEGSNSSLSSGDKDDDEDDDDEKVEETNVPFLVNDLQIKYRVNDGYLSSPDKMVFNAMVFNNGIKKVDISGYKMRFYLSDQGDVRVKDFATSIPNITGMNAEIERCAADKYALTFSFEKNISVDAGNTFPQDQWQWYTISNTDYIAKESQRSYLSIPNSQTILNPEMALFNERGKIVYGNAAWNCEGFKEKELKIVVEESVKGIAAFDKKQSGDKWPGAQIEIKIKNEGDSAVAAPAFLNVYVTHPSGMVPVIANGTDTLAHAGTALIAGKSVTRISSGSHHLYSVKFADGIPANMAEQTLKFDFFDACLYDCVAESKEFYYWNFSDDWSLKNGSSNSAVTDYIVVKTSKNEVVYGKEDPNAPTINVVEVDEEKVDFIPMHSPGKNPMAKANRTDAESYALGQVISDGTFEDPTLLGWSINGTVENIRENAPQGSRYVKISNHSSIKQTLPSAASNLLADSGAVVSYWHNGSYLKICINPDNSYSGSNCKDVSWGQSWKKDTLYFEKEVFNKGKENKIVLIGNMDIDDLVMTPGSRRSIVNYAVRFTTTQHEELETRAYDGESELLITTSQRDFMGRLSKKYLPYAVQCIAGINCNTSEKTAGNKDEANRYYTADREGYPEAGNVAYVETSWKPDQAATKEVETMPGAAFKKHYTQAFSSGVNLSGVNLFDSTSLNDSILAVKDEKRFYDRKGESRVNYHAKANANPTHLWEMNIDPDDRKVFTIKDGEGRVVVSGSLNDDWTLNTRSVYVYNENGLLQESHSPMSCNYTPKSKACVRPSMFEYDAEGRLVQSYEPDADTTQSYYDLMGRLRATQSQNQIKNKTASVIVYDDLGRVSYSGEWKSGRDSIALKDYFQKNYKFQLPAIEELVPGTITRNIYDHMPPRDTLGLNLYPSFVEQADFKYTKTFLMATISDVKIDEATNTVVRRSVANKYDKYGRVLESYVFDDDVADLNLKTLGTKTEYDLGGRVIKVTKYPYGYSDKSKSVVERYTYDRLGRVDSIYVKNGYSNEKLLASYVYYPLGTLKSVTLGDNITVTYTYHISGAVKSATTSSKFQDKPLYKETLFYEDCGSTDCKPQYNGNVSQMTHYLAHNVNGVSNERNVTYIYDFLNRLELVKDSEIPDMDEMFAYDAQGRIVQQLRGEKAGNADENSADGIYSYYENTNMLNSVSDGIGGSAEKRNMSNKDNFVYDRDGNLIEDKSKRMTIAYDWRGMPVEFKRQDKCYDIHEQVVCDSIKLEIAYDGAGSRVSKTLLRKLDGTTGWNLEKKTHYTGIGSEIRVDGQNGTKVVVNMPQGLGRYAIESDNGTSNGDEFYLKNHLGSTMMVAKVTGSNTPAEVSAVYDYRAFGEQVDLAVPAEKVTENFTSKERDDETELNYFGTRYLDPMLGLWTSVDPARQFSSPYLYMGNGYNPIIGYDPDGNDAMVVVTGNANAERQTGNITIDGENYAYDFNTYRLDVFLNVENWKDGQTYNDYTPDASFWASRDAWMKEDNKAVISGDGMLAKSTLPKGSEKGWLTITNGKTDGYFKGISALKNPDIWWGESMHPGTPMYSEGCVTSRDYKSIRRMLDPDLNAKRPIKIHFEPFVPESRPVGMPIR
ncbi:RHS repeat-associated core domain-containing protein [Fibrobacter sp. UWR1]|uniref:RHS repeat domain-containing protein n=1 Tax=Fibrobacter sp. UWR1 TaxID=2135645 RepID=UPI000DB5A145|nr:RHS repeat-associated core domain-containing protein [Fibrobacter sp. UWR1]PZW62348.1 RHS repeat-associated protein [Fibrobacter sp. UWR1]